MFILFTVTSVKEDESGTKVMFPVPGTITRCPLYVDDAVKECHSTINYLESSVHEILDKPGTYVIRIR